MAERAKEEDTEEDTHTQEEEPISKTAPRTRFPLSKLRKLSEEVVLLADEVKSLHDTLTENTKKLLLMFHGQ